MNIYVMLWGSLTRCTYEMWRTQLCRCFPWNIASAKRKKWQLRGNMCGVVKLSHTALWWWVCGYVTDSCQLMQYQLLLGEIFNNPAMFGSQLHKSALLLFLSFFLSHYIFFTIKQHHCFRFNIISTVPYSFWNQTEELQLKLSFT